MSCAERGRDQRGMIVHKWKTDCASDKSGRGEQLRRGGRRQCSVRVAIELRQASSARQAPKEGAYSLPRCRPKLPIADLLGPAPKWASPTGGNPQGGLCGGAPDKNRGCTLESGLKIGVGKVTEPLDLKRRRISQACLANADHRKIRCDPLQECIHPCGDQRRSRRNLGRAPGSIGGRTPIAILLSRKADDLPSRILHHERKIHRSVRNNRMAPFAFVSPIGNRPFPGSAWPRGSNAEAPLHTLHQERAEART